MKILHCLHNYHPARGGAEWLMKNVSELLVQRGHEVRVIATTAYSVEDYFLPGKRKKLFPEGSEDQSGVNVRRVPFSRKGAAFLNLARKVANRIPIPLGDRLRLLSWGPRSRAYRRELERSGKFDLVAASPLPTLNVWYAWRYARRKGLPFILIPCFHTEDRWTYHNPIYFRMLRDADAVITLTEWEKMYLEEVIGVSGDKVHTTGVGITQSFFPEQPDIRKKYGIRQKEIVLYLGQQGAHKGLPDLIRAMTYVWETQPDSALVMAGNPTAHTAEVERIIDDLPQDFKDRVYLIKGFPEEEKRAFLNEADIFVSVSPFESFGIVYLEAWMEKLPVIGCSRGGSAKLISQLRDGLLVSDGEQKELAGAILELLENPDVRTSMGEAGYRKAKNLYNWESVMDLWEGVYSNVL